MSDTSQELEFAAEDTRVTIIPNFGHVKFTFISSECGPFEPGLPVEVPLWLALTLKRRLKCQVQPPEWLELEALRTALEKEKEGASFGENVPYHYLEIAAMLLNGAKDDIPNHDAIRTAVEDLKDIRQRKVRSGIRGIVGNEFGDTADGDVLKQVGGIAIKMRGIAAMEIHAMRDHFLLALERMQSLAMAEDELYRDDATAPGGGGGRRGRWWRRRRRCGGAQPRSRAGRAARCATRCTEKWQRQRQRQRQCQRQQRDAGEQQQCNTGGDRVEACGVGHHCGGSRRGRWCNGGGGWCGGRDGGGWCGE
jgi:GINS complex subunit 2